MMGAAAMFALLAGAFAFVAVGVGTVWWALFRDKARGRRRCPRCWHDLSATPGMTCGECGFAARTEGDFARTRRRWGTAALALVLILAVAGWTRLQVLNTGLANLLPNAVMVTLAGWIDPADSGGEIARELRRRLFQDEFTPAQLTELAQAIVDSQAGRGLPPPFAAEMLRTIGDALPGPLQTKRARTEAERAAIERDQVTWAAGIDAILRRLGTTLRADAPRAWPAGREPAVRVRGAAWGLRGEWRARLDGSGTWIVWDSAADPRADFTPLVVPVPAARDADRIDARILVQSRTWDGAGGAWREWRDEPALEVHAPLARGAAEAFRPDPSPELDAEMLRTFRERIVAWRDRGRPVGMRHLRGTFMAPQWADLCIGVAYELRERGEVRRRTRFWWHGGTSSPQFGWITELEDRDALLRLADAAAGGGAPEGWTMAIRADPDAAAFALPFDASPMPAARWWPGEGEWPLDVEFGGRNAPPRLFRPETVTPPAADPATAPR